MKILIAGATGAIGKPLIDLLIHDGHDVFGITQSKERALIIAAKGVKPLNLNVLDRNAVFEAFAATKPEIVIDMLTSLPKEYTQESMKAVAELDAKVRREGGANILEAAREFRAKRLIAQSSAFWYAPGTGFADESAPFAREATPGISAGVALYEEIEQRTLQSQGIDGVALRFGFFYGPGTWFHPEGHAAVRIKVKNFPIIGNGEGVWNFVHIEDAAQAIVSSIYSYPGAYNIVNDHPSPIKEWLPAFARSLKVRTVPWIGEEEGLRQFGPDAVYYSTKLRAASHAKAREEFNFLPRACDWFF